MKKIIGAIVCAAIHTFSSAQEKPKLVVGIVVDQMRQEYLYRFEKKFGPSGFKRLMNEGFMLTNAHYNYVPTYTGLAMLPFLRELRRLFMALSE